MAWPTEIQQHILGECPKCLAIIADDPKYGRKPNKTDLSLCECCVAYADSGYIRRPAK